MTRQKQVTLADYPFDPTAQVELLRGLDKLRAIEDRVMAQQLFDLFWVAEANANDPNFKHREQLELRRKAKLEHERLQRVSDGAFRGEYGQAAKDLAESMLVDDTQRGRPRRTDVSSLEEFEKELRELRQRGAA